MSAVDFEAWAIPDLEIVMPANGRRNTYRVPPPSVERASKILAAAVLAEVELGMIPGPVPEPVRAVLATITPGDHPALGPVHDQMIDDGVNPTSVDRAAYYAVFYWARGKSYADALALLLWAPRAGEEDTAGSGEPAPKVRTR